VVSGTATERIDETATAQVALFAVQWAVAEVWRELGVRPAVVVGHSVGEYAAACVAGVVEVEAAARVVAARGRLMGALPGDGAMAAVEGGVAVVEAAVQRARAAGAGEVGIAAMNAADSVVVSGTAAAVAAVVERLTAIGIRAQGLRVSHAFHSGLMTPMQGAFGLEVGHERWGTPRMAWVSTVTGRTVEGGEIGADYWVRQVREPVQFAAAMETVRTLGVEACVEVGPGTTLLGLGRRCLDGAERIWAPSLRAGREDSEQMLESLGQLWTAGVAVDWAALDREQPRRRVSLPTYPWQGEPHWLEASGPDDRARRTPLDVEAAWAAVVTAGRIQATQSPLDLDLASFPGRWRALERLSTAYIVEALRRLRVFAVAGEVHTAEGLREAHGIAPTYRHLLSRWLRRLAALGLVTTTADTFVAPRPLPDPDLAGALGEARATLGDVPALLEYVERCGSHLVEILTGAASPLETLFPDGSFATAEALYQDWALSRYFSALVRSVVVARAGQAVDASLRVIEIGAGTGGTTAALLPALPPDRTVYWFTDVSTAFLARAEQKWPSHGFVRYGILDIERDPAEQGFPRHGFDAVVATNVIHATRDIPATLGRARSLLAPGGLLILCEATAHLPWFDVTTGLIEGWQRFEEPARSDSPLLTAADWRAVLERAGFDGVVVLPESGSPAEILGQHVLVARAPAEIGPASDAAPRRIERVSVADRAATPASVEAARRLREALPGDRNRLAVEYVVGQVAAVLRVARPETLDPRQPLMDLGLDSLMAVELRSRLALGLGLGRGLPATLIFEHPSIEAIAALLVRLVAEGSGTSLEERAAVAAATPAVAAAAERIAELSEDEVEALLVKKLESL
jgi:malonyl CoA-acyl carrier protein transacylase